MRITILSGSVPTTTFIDALVNAMASEGYKITVIGKAAGSFTYHDNVRVVIIPSGILARLSFVLKLMLRTRPATLFQILASSRNIADAMNNFIFYLPVIHSKPGRIHLQWTAFVHDRDLLFQLFPGKIIVSLRGAHINYTPITTPAIRESYIRLLPKVHMFHAVCCKIVEEAAQYGVDSSRTRVIYSMVAPQLLEKAIEPKHADNKLKIISVGRFHWKKGYEYALDAIAILRERSVPFQYTLIAEGETPASIIYQVHQAGIGNQVQIINGLPHSEVIEQLEKHDIMLLTSVEEGIPNVVLESMAVGTPVLTTNVGGLAELVVDGETGYIVPARDVHAIADCLEDFSRQSQQQRFEIAGKAKEAVRRNHNKQKFVEEFKALYST